jgi:hypothetical protein
MKLDVQGYPFPMTIRSEFIPSIPEKSNEILGIAIAGGVVFTVTAFVALFNCLKDKKVLEYMKPYLEKLEEILKERYKEYATLHSFLLKQNFPAKIKSISNKIKIDINSNIMTEEEFLKNALQTIVAVIRKKNNRLHIYTDILYGDYDVIKGDQHAIEAEINQELSKIKLLLDKINKALEAKFRNTKLNVELYDSAYFKEDFEEGYYKFSSDDYGVRYSMDTLFNIPDGIMKKLKSLDTKK